MPQIKREDLQPGAVIESTAKPGKGIAYRIVEVRGKSFNNSFINYFAEAVMPDAGNFRYKRHLTLNHIRRFYKMLSKAPTAIPPDVAVTKSDLNNLSAFIEQRYAALMATPEVIELARKEFTDRLSIGLVCELLLSITPFAGPGFVIIFRHPGNGVSNAGAEVTNA